MNRNFIVYLILISCTLLLDVDAPIAQVSLSRKPGLKIKSIYIDPAYGGDERGPTFAQNNYGKNITLLIAQKLHSLLTGAGFTVYLSRDEDKFVPFETRTFRAKSKGADVYLTINVSNQKKDCIRLLTTTSPKEKKPVQTAETKKLNELHGELNDMFKNLQTHDKYEASLDLAQKLKINLQYDRFVDCIKMLSIYDYILLNAEMPAVIVDLGVSKQSKNPYILNAETQDQIVGDIAASIEAYSDERAPSLTQ